MKNLKTFEQLNEASKKEPNITIEYKGCRTHATAMSGNEKLSRLLKGEFSSIKSEITDDPDNPPTWVGGIIKLTGPKDLLYKFCSENPPYPEWNKENPSPDSL